MEKCEEVVSKDYGIKPFLRWAGSKRQAIPILKKHYEKVDFNTYIEPFLGAGHLFFNSIPNQSILNDINKELIITYRCIQKHYYELYTMLNKMIVDKSYYYYLREIDITSLNTIQRAARFIYLNRYCFNGLYRTDSKGNFNVPFSPNKSGKLPSLEDLSKLSYALKDSLILNEDFECIVKKYVTKNSLVYLDPPYVSNTKTFTEYSQYKFAINDLNRVKNCLNYINQQEAFFIFSYILDEDLLDSLKMWNIYEIEVKRKISCNINTRKIVKEVIITNY